MIHSMKRKAAAVRTLKQARTYMGSMAAIVLWNTVYLDRAVQALRKRGEMIPAALLVQWSR
jgi:TnpA family transposase